jgi:hypothetical protein
VRNYAVIAPIEDLVAHGRAIHEEQDGLRRRLVLSRGEGNETRRAARMQPDRERARQAAIELWGTAGPPDHLSNSSICREVAQLLKKNGQAAEISDATIFRAVGRK